MEQLDSDQSGQVGGRPFFESQGFWLLAVGLAPLSPEDSDRVLQINQLQSLSSTMRFVEPFSKKKNMRFSKWAGGGG